MACYSGVSTLQLHGTALLESARLPRPVHLVLDAPWGFALWGFTELPRPTLVVTGCPSPHYLRDSWPWRRRVSWPHPRALRTCSRGF